MVRFLPFYFFLLSRVLPTVAAMTEIVLILVLGVIGQWVAWRLRVPSILLLLLLGFLAGPVTHWVKPDELLGALLLPMVSLSVALILFEGGLSLHIADLRQVGGVVRNLASVGALTTAVVSTGAAYYILGLQWSLAALLGRDFDGHRANRDRSTAAAGAPDRPGWANSALGRDRDRPDRRHCSLYSYSKPSRDRSRSILTIFF